MTTDRPLIEFVRLIEEARPPKRADRSAAGYIPSRALRYCDPLTSATGFGYWLFPPIDVRLLWDGADIFWSFGSDDTWLPLSGTDSRAVQFPDFAAAFDATAPEFLRGYSPPFLAALPEVGAVQMWTGLLARTRPGWSISVRSPVNLPPIPNLVTWEGVIETDIWLGPLFTNFRITKTDTTVQIRAHTPFLQIQPLPQLAYREETLASFGCPTADALSESDWRSLGNVLLPDPSGDLRQGQYAVAVRKRRGRPVIDPIVGLEQPL